MYIHDTCHCSPWIHWLLTIAPLPNRQVLGVSCLPLVFVFIYVFEICLSFTKEILCQNFLSNPRRCVCEKERGKDRVRQRQRQEEIDRSRGEDKDRQIQRQEERETEVEEKTETVQRDTVETRYNGSEGTGRFCPLFGVSLIANSHFFWNK